MGGEGSVAGETGWEGSSDEAGEHSQSQRQWAWTWGGGRWGSLGGEVRGTINRASGAAHGGGADR